MYYFLLNILPQVATVLIGLMYIPQIIKTHRTKDVKGIAYSFWVILVLALIVNTINAFAVYQITGVYGTLITQGTNFILAFIVFLQIGYYKRKEKQKNMKEENN